MLLFFLMLWLTLVNYFFMKLGIFFVILPCPGCSRIFLVSCAFFPKKLTIQIIVPCLAICKPVVCIFHKKNDDPCTAEFFCYHFVHHVFVILIDCWCGWKRSNVSSIYLECHGYILLTKTTKSFCLNDK